MLRSKPKYLLVLMITLIGNASFAQQTNLELLEERYQVFRDNEILNPLIAAEALIKSKSMVDSILSGGVIESEFEFRMLQYHIYSQLSKISNSRTDPYRINGKYDRHHLIAKAALALRFAIQIAPTQQRKDTLRTSILFLAGTKKSSGETMYNNGRPFGKLEKANFDFYSSHYYYNAVDSLNPQITFLLARTNFSLAKTDSASKYLDLILNSDNISQAAMHYRYQILYNLDTAVLNGNKQPDFSPFNLKEQNKLRLLAQAYQDSNDSIAFKPIDYPILWQIGNDYLNMDYYDLAENTFQLLRPVDSLLGKMEYGLSSVYRDKAWELETKLKNSEESAWHYNDLEEEMNQYYATSFDHLMVALETDSTNIDYIRRGYDLMRLLKREDEAEVFKTKIESNKGQH